MMLEPGMTLQDRYRVIRKLGGGGMGIVYLSEDIRLPGRYCAVKEMSPTQLAAQDRDWAIQAFQQEAQMLGTLSHPGLAAVTDFFAEGGNWYLVMAYVDGESLDQRLQHVPHGRLSTQETLSIARQLCDVLIYLHHCKPPVIFRDLKPSNVMVMPSGQVKLIDFGIARFFKPGQTRDTLNMGTPGYAAPEQYGGMGQSDPRTDVYSLGVLLYRMLSGYDPSGAVTPFSLPAIESLVTGVSAELAVAIVKAKQMQPDLRYDSIAELREALFSPTTEVLPPEQKKQSWKTRKVARTALLPKGASTNDRMGQMPTWIGILRTMGVVGILGFCMLAVLLAMLFLDPFKFIAGSPTPTLEIDSKQPTPTSFPPTAEVTLTPAPAQILVEHNGLGRSVEGREIALTSVGYGQGVAVVVVGSIQGDQKTTRDLVEGLSFYFEQNLAAIPEDAHYYFISSLNPDGNVNNSRYNAHDVDLNRNWETADWVADAAVPGYSTGRAGAGGDQPFSEPETLALRDFLLATKARYSDLLVVIYHSSVRRTTGEIYPGGSAALGFARSYAAVTDYDIEYAWADYVTSGEAVTWCDEQGIQALDVVIPASQSPDSRVAGTFTLLDLAVSALLGTVQ